MTARRQPDDGVGQLEDRLAGVLMVLPADAQVLLIHLLASASTNMETTGASGAAA